MATRSHDTDSLYVLRFNPRAVVSNNGFSTLCLKNQPSVLGETQNTVHILYQLSQITWKRDQELRLISTVARPENYWYNKSVQIFWRGLLSQNLGLNSVWRWGVKQSSSWEKGRSESRQQTWNTNGDQALWSSTIWSKMTEVKCWRSNNKWTMWLLAINSVS